MAGKDKNIKTDLSGFLHYRGKKMPNKERNDFERELERDPFAAEAAEGFSELSPEVIKNDLENLTKRLTSRTRIRQRIVYYSIAASVAVLMIISSVFVVLQLNKPDKLVGENVINETPFEISKPSAIAEPKSKDDNKIALNEIKRDKKETKEATPATVQNEIIGEKAVSDQKIAAAADRVNEIAAMPGKKEVEMRISEPEQSRALSKATSVNKQLTEPVIIKGKIISSEDNLPIPGAMVTVKGTTLGTQTDSGGNFAITLPDQKNYALVANFIGMESKEFSVKGDSTVQVRLNNSLLALEEVVVVGYGAKRKSEKDMTGAVSSISPGKADESGYTPPRPINGKEEFDKYIEDNIRKPIEDITGKNEVVVISFIVKANGIRDSIKIIRSPGKSFSDEAIRLIKEGPAWIPAEQNRVSVDEEVRIRIVFR